MRYEEAEAGVRAILGTEHHGVFTPRLVSALIVGLVAKDVLTLVDVEAIANAADPMPGAVGKPPQD